MTINIIEVGAIINRPVEQIFSFVSNSENNDQWMNDVRKIHKLTDGPISEGTEFEYKRKAAGRLIEGTISVSKYKPNQHYAYESIGGNVRGQVDYLFNPLPYGTEFNIRLSMDMSSMPQHHKPIWPIALFFVKRRYQKDVNKLKKLLEA